MIPIEYYWCEDKPTLEDIKFAYERVEQGVVVTIRWFVAYSGYYEKTITPQIVEDVNYTDYFNEAIPHTYPV